MSCHVGYVALIGRPNVGKSTLLNTLLNKERAIVTSTPGTTRDTIEEEIDIKGLPFTIIDTAGLRDPSSEIEREGIFRTNKQIKRADILLFLVNANEEITAKDIKISDRLPPEKTIILSNKIDLGKKLSTRQINHKLGKGWANILEISAKKGEGIKDLEEELTKLVWGGQVNKEEDMILLDAREKYQLEQARKHLDLGRENLINGHPVDLAEMDIRQARTELGKITGEDLTEEVIDRMFSDFCVGK